MADHVLSLLGLMRVSGKLAFTESSCRQALSSNMSKMILVSSDASGSLIEKYKMRAECQGIPFVVLPYSKVQLASALGCSLCSILSINDSGFVLAMNKLLA